MAACPERRMTPFRWPQLQAARSRFKPFIFGSALVPLWTARWEGASWDALPAAFIFTEDPVASIGQSVLCTVRSNQFRAVRVCYTPGLFYESTLQG